MALMTTSRILTAVVSRSLSVAGTSVSTPQLRVLVMLSSQGPLNLTAVAQGLGVNASNASRACDQLVAAGLVIRRGDADDRRHIALSLSDSGTALVESLMSYRRRVLVRIVESMSSVERAAMARGLDAFNRVADKLSAIDEDSEDEDHLLRWLT